MPVGTASKFETRVGKATDWVGGSKILPNSDEL